MNKSEKEALSCLVSEMLYSNNSSREVVSRAQELIMNNDNKHPHHDLIVEWAKDTSNRYQFLDCDSEWEDCDEEDGPCWCADTKYRRKPREFVKGHWYPCVFKSEDKDAGYPMMFNGGGFVNHKNDEHPCLELNFSFIGESLGEINFGG